LAEEVGRGNRPGTGILSRIFGSAGRDELIVIVAAALVFLVSIVSPPFLVDDVDSVQAQIARNMLQSGDWVTARLDGVAYLEKAPLKYWLMAGSFRIFGVHDWAARLPLAIAAILLCWVTVRFARWAMGPQAAFYAGLCLATCVGLFLFTRVLIPDVMLTLAITMALWSLLRALDTGERRPRLWAMVFWASMAVGVLLKGLIACVFPVGSAAIFLGITGQLWKRDTWRRVHVFTGLLVFLAIAAPWHVLATLRNPPFFDFTMHSESGSYRGFFWFYFFNEHILRFLNKRYPRDYNTVPRLWFWLFHLIWLFPWSVYLPAVARLRFRDADRGSRVRLLALCWTGFVLLFFTFSTTQEYYSMPCYPALAILLGAAMASSSRALKPATKAAAAIVSVLGCVLLFLLAGTRGLASPGDISAALTQNPDVYTLSLGHMADLTFQAFAYLRAPLALAAVALFLGAAGAWAFHGRRAYLSLAFMMVLFFQAARMALGVFDPYLGSKPLADALNSAPAGQLIVDDQYYTFSSIFFYTGRTALLLNGRVNNLEYGSYAPGAPDVFLDDAGFERRWASRERYYVVAEVKPAERLHGLARRAGWYVLRSAGGKVLVTNQPPGQ
jgi:4-amino-4-deoxy-L-arabinose transferase-like glycosyltransferase